jgi:hypothetical protein
MRQDGHREALLQAGRPLHPIAQNVRDIHYGGIPSAPDVTVRGVIGLAASDKADVFHAGCSADR